MEENDKDSEIKELKKSLEKAVKENENLKKFNEDLRNQVKLLTGKLNLFQQLNNNTKSSTATTGNESSIISSSNKTKSEHNDWMQESISKKMKITDLVTSIAQQNVSLNDYIYDSKSKTYYSKSTGWFYYEDQNLFFDTNTKNYYSYDREKNTYAFHSTLDDVLKRRREEKKKELKSNKEDDDDCEDGEILSSGEDSNSEEDEKKPIDDSNEADQIQPCIRLIVQQADNLDLGSLLIVTVKGANLGKLNSCELQLDEESVADLHAKVTFNDDNRYYIEDLNSEYGTFINDNQIEPNQQIRLKHLDILRLGDIEFLTHIHDKNNSCVYCEPGCVQAKLKSLIPQVTNIDFPIMSKEEKEKARKKELKQLMKKFGINKYEKSEQSINSENYQDRAAERRKIKGSSSEHFKTVQVSLDKPIDESNRGFKLLEKMGWKKNEEKDTKLIETKQKDDRFGLGFN